MKPQDLIAQATTLSDEDRQKIIEELQASLTPKKYTRDDAVKEISGLPQSNYINDFDMHNWLDKVDEYDPERLPWHVRRLNGFGGSEIGTLWMSLHDEYHPFHSCTDVVRGKFLQEMPLAPEGNLQRGSMMEDPILRVKFREQMTKKYAALGQTVRFRDDLFEKFMYYKDPDPGLSWLIGTPDDIMEVDGKLIIVDYKAPTSGTIAALKRYASNEAPVYYDAQLHHYASIAEKVGLPVGGLMLASLDYDKFIFDIRELPVRRDFQAELIDAGNYYWHEFVLKGLIPPPGTKKAFSREVPLTPEMEAAAREYAVLSTITNSSKAARDDLQEALLHTPISLDVDVIQAGMVNITANRTYKDKELLEYLEQIGVDTRSAVVKNDFDETAMVTALKAAFNVSDETDSVFDPLRKKSEDGTAEHINTSELVYLAREAQINLSQFVLTETCKMELSRSKAGSGPSLRIALADCNESILRDATQQLTGVYDETKKMFIEATAPAKPKAAI